MAFKLWDSKMNQFLSEQEHKSISTAVAEKERYLVQEGNYPDEPTSVIEIHEYAYGKFLKNHTSKVPPQ